MVKKLIFVLLLVSMCFGCAGCSDMQQATVNEKEPTFRIVEQYGDGDAIVDTDTGVMYWRSTGCYNGGTLTLLVDKNGNPKIFEQEE